MDERSERVARRLEIPMLGVALLVIPAIILEEAHRSGAGHDIGLALNWLIWAAFTVELVVMLAVVPSRRDWLRSHPLEVAIVALTSPVLLTSLGSIRLLRLLRLVRLFRLAPVARRLFSLTGLKYTGFVALLTLIVGADAFASAEQLSVGDGLYWAMTTMTTVGYGDIVPHTDTGKAVAVSVMIVGIGFFAILTGAVANRFLSGQLEEVQAEVQALEAGEEPLLDEIRDIGKRLRQVEEALARAARQRQGPHGPAGGSER